MVRVDVIETLQNREQFSRRCRLLRLSECVENFYGSAAVRRPNDEIDEGAFKRGKVDDPGQMGGMMGPSSSQKGYAAI
jgi:hypothetical protein